MSDAYSHWRACLAGADPGWIDEPQAGFWRRLVGQRYRPVAIWPGANGALVCLDGDREIEPWRAWSPRIQATTEAAYRTAVAGEPYPDELSDSAGETTRDLSRAAVIRPKGK